MYVFAEADELKKLIEPLQDIARKFISEVGYHNYSAAEKFSIFFFDYDLISLTIIMLQIMMVLVDVKEDNLAKPFLTLFGLEESEDAVVSFLPIFLSVLLLVCLNVSLVLNVKHVLVGYSIRLQQWYEVYGVRYYSPENRGNIFFFFSCFLCS